MCVCVCVCVFERDDGLHCQLLRGGACRFVCRMRVV